MCIGSTSNSRQRTRYSTSLQPEWKNLCCKQCTNTDLNRDAARCWGSWNGKNCHSLFWNIDVDTVRRALPKALPESDVTVNENPLTKRNVTSGETIAPFCKEIATISGKLWAVFSYDREEVLVTELKKMALYKYSNLHHYVHRFCIWRTTLCVLVIQERDHLRICCNMSLLATHG